MGLRKNQNFGEDTKKLMKGLIDYIKQLARYQITVANMSQKANFVNDKGPVTISLPGETETEQ